MDLKLYYHPLASFCHKALIALYENETPFEPIFVDLGDAKSATDFRAVWPMGKFPVLRDDARKQTVAESSVVIEYLDAFYPGATRFVPSDPDAAWRARMWDRFFDEYVQKPMQLIVGDRLRPEGKRDPFGVEQARSQLQASYVFLEREIAMRPWAAGSEFTLADCSAAPALFYAELVEPFGEARQVATYFDRLAERSSFARVLREAEPYFSNVPLERKPQLPRSLRARTA
jgi:glutathione S-transferase